MRDIELYKAILGPAAPDVTPGSSALPSGRCRRGRGRGLDRRAQPCEDMVRIQVNLQEDHIHEDAPAV